MSGSYGNEHDNDGDNDDEISVTSDSDYESGVMTDREYDSETTEGSDCDHLFYGYTNRTTPEQNIGQQQQCEDKIDLCNLDKFDQCNLDKLDQCNLDKLNQCHLDNRAQCNLDKIVKHDLDNLVVDQITPVVHSKFDYSDVCIFGNDERVITEINNKQRCSLSKIEKCTLDKNDQSILDKINQYIVGQDDEIISDDKHGQVLNKNEKFISIKTDEGILNSIDNSKTKFQSNVDFSFHQTGDVTDFSLDLVESPRRQTFIRSKQIESMTVNSLRDNLTLCYEALDDQDSQMYEMQQ